MFFCQNFKESICLLKQDFPFVNKRPNGKKNAGNKNYYFLAKAKHYSLAQFSSSVKGKNSFFGDLISFLEDRGAKNAFVFFCFLLFPREIVFIFYYNKI